MVSRSSQQSIEDLLTGSQIIATPQVLSATQPALSKKNLLTIGQKVSNNTTLSLTQQPNESQVRYNKDGSISKKRGPKPKQK